MRYSILVFLAAGLLRAIPEIIAGPYPVGFDVNAYYPFMILSFPSTNFADLLRTFPLFSGMMWAIHSLTGANVFFLLKLAGPILYGSLAFSFLLFLTLFLKFDLGRSTLGTILLSLQPVLLRVSWDLFRNELGLVFSLLSLASLGIGWRYKYVLIGALSILAVLAHPLSAIVMFVGVLGLLLSKRTELSRTRIILSHAPAAVLFIATLLVILFVPSGASSVVMMPVNPQTSLAATLFGVFPAGSPVLSPARLGVLVEAAALFLVAFAPMLIFVARGFWSNPALSAMTTWLLFGSLGFMAPQLLFVPVYWRWELLLIVPFAAYFLRGLERLGFFHPGRRFFRGLLVTCFLILALGYSSGGFSYMSLYGAANFSPGTMVQGSLRVDQTKVAIAELQWLRQSAPQGSAVLTDERFMSYAYLSGEGSFRIFVQPGCFPLPSTIDTALLTNPPAMYVIWDSIPASGSFVAIHSQDGIFILQYTTLN